MDIKDKSIDFQKGYISHNNELIAIWNDAIKYDLPFKQLIAMINDFIKYSINVVNDTGNFIYREKGDK